METHHTNSPVSHFAITAQRVGQLHLTRSFAFRFKQLWIGDKNANAFCARCCDIETVQAVMKLHSARGIFGRRCGHRINHHRSFLTLKLIDGSNAAIGNFFCQLKDLRIVRRNNQNVIHIYRKRFSIFISPAYSGCCKLPHDLRNNIGFLNRTALIAFMLHRNEKQC
jgi:hypothetical protein